MATDMDRGKLPESLTAYRPGRDVTTEEVKAILADEGYAASERETWLKSLLTDVSQDDGQEAEEGKDELVDLIEQEISRLHNR
ncbi:hypothetical protein [Maricaulis sp. CAU 1757]